MIKLGYPLHWEDRFLQAIDWRHESQKAKISNLRLSLEEEKNNTICTESNPSYYLLEVTNRCNLRCALCPTQYNDTDMPRGFVDVDYFKDVVNHIKEHAIVLEMQNWGEPFLHKEITQLTKIASDSGIFTIISSNFSLKLSDQVLTEIINSGLGVLHVDVDGLTQETYVKYRRGGDISIVLDNLKRIIQLKKDLRADHPIIETAMIVNRFNEKEVVEYRERMKELGVDEVNVSKLQISPSISKDWLPNNPELRYNNYLEDSMPAQSCQRLYTSMTINWDGRISPCCLTYDKESDFAKSTSGLRLKEIWNNELFMAARQSFGKDSDSSPHTICHDCKNCLGDSNLNHFRDTFAIASRKGI